MTGEREKSDGQSRVGTTIAGKYRLDRLLGKGGMGAVYEATHTGIDRKFALKLMHEHTERAPDGEARFEREARAAGRIGHPNIVDVFDFGRTEDGAPYIVMELCAGESLAERIARGPLPLREAAEIGVEILGALEAAHSAGIVHRDIKPANVFVLDPSAQSGRRPEGGNEKRSVKVLDFGIAKFVELDVTLTNTGAVIGSPLYMAPEQVRAEKDVDARADIWSVGATLYELIAGVAAHSAPTHAAVIARIVTVPAASLRTHREEVDAQLDAIVLRALSIDKNARFSTAAEMVVALDNYLSGSANTVASLPPVGMTQLSLSQSKGAASTKTISKRAWWIAASLTCTAAVAIAFVVKGEPPANAPDNSPRGAAAPSTSQMPPSPIEVPSASAPAPTASASASPSDVPAAAQSAHAIAHIDSSAHASSSGAAHVVTTHASAPTCVSPELPSFGHCCRAGLVWQGDRCDRPLATTAPF